MAKQSPSCVQFVAATTAAIGWLKEKLPHMARTINGSQGTFTSAEDLEKAIKNAWMVVECIPEINDAKVKLLWQLDRLCPPNTPIATI
jgi:3-hydroxybutyryl-CoA dehydrogenase